MPRPRQRVLSAGVILVHRGEPCRFLLLRAYNYWDFPKGECAAGESPLAAALREVAEETGIVEVLLRWGEQFRETEPYGRGKVARYYVGESGTTEVTLGVSPELGRPEHHEFRWTTFEEGRALLAPRVRPILDWARAVAGCGEPGGRS